jgi:hypothetical protein
MALSNDNAVDGPGIGLRDGGVKGGFRGVASAYGMRRPLSGAVSVSGHEVEFSD